MVIPLSDKEKESVRHKFDSYCKKVLRYTAINHNNEIQYITGREVSFSDLPQNIYPMSVKDEYFSQSRSFDTSAGSVVVKGYDISEIISALPDRQREIILLYYIAEKTDREIGKNMNMPRSTVQYQRDAAIKILKKIMEDWNDEI